ncbi:MAG: hypothetical protein WCS88_04075 [Patescibacteria group bacterium]|jgi:hypothetical protein
MATVVDTLTWAAVSTALKAHLSVTGTSEDTTLAMLLDAACLAADAFLGSEAFLDDDGLDITIPGSVYIGVYEWVRMARAEYQRGAAPEVTSTSTGDFSETRARATSSSSFTRAVKHYWQPSRKGVWR